jgi:hypothetical protein
MVKRAIAVEIVVIELLVERPLVAAVVIAGDTAENLD